MPDRRSTAPRNRFAITAAVAAIALSTSTGAVAAAAGSAPTATIVITPASGAPTTPVQVTGGGFAAGEVVDLRFDGTTLATTTATGQGGIAGDVTVPAATQPGRHAVSAIGETDGLVAREVFSVRTDWPQFRFDSDRTGFQPFEDTVNPTNVRRLELASADQLGELVDYSSPAVVDNVAYIGSDDGVLWAYPAAGCGHSLCTQPLWKSSRLAQIVDSPAVSGGFVYVGSQTSATSAAGKLDVFAAAGCGQAVCPPLWQGVAGTQSILMSSPTVSGGVVYVGGFDGNLYAFTAAGCGHATCQPLWTGATGGSIESSPTVSGGTVYIGSDDGKLYAFPASGCGQPTCAPTWTGPLGGAVEASSPAVSGGTVFIGSDHALVAFPAAGCGAATCQPLWRGTSGADFFGGSPAVHAGRVFIGIESNLGVFKAQGCGAATCSPTHLYEGAGEQASIVSSPTVADGVVYVGRNTGQVLAWPEKPCASFTCIQTWSSLTNEPIVSSSPTVVDGRVYIGSADDSAPANIQGRLYVFTLGGALH